MIIIPRQFKIDSQSSELLPEAGNISGSPGKCTWMLIHQSQGASQEAGAACGAGEPNQMNKPERHKGLMGLKEGSTGRKNQGSRRKSGISYTPTGSTSISLSKGPTDGIS